MDINIVLDPEYSPQQIAEIAVKAERVGIRALWSSNYHQHRDAFVALVPAALATSKILMGPLAISPWEMHPLKIANAWLTLNEVSGGRAMLGVGGGGGVLSAVGWKAAATAPTWPAKHPTKGTRYPDRRVRAVRECLEILQGARSGKPTMGYKGEVFEITRPFQMKWGSTPRPLLYACSTGPQMLVMGARCADGIQLSDFTLERLPAVMACVREGLASRQSAVEGFRLGNFWAWHLKHDREASLYEARRELIWRGPLIGKEAEELARCCTGPEELQLILDHWENFRKAYWTRTGRIDGVPADLVNRLIAGLSSAGDLGDLDRELERFQQFKAAGLTELDLRVHDHPMEALDLIGTHVVPAVQ